MEYILENITFGFTPDEYVFDSRDDALEYLKACVDIGNPAENQRKLDLCRKFRGCNYFAEAWSITERDHGVYKFCEEFHVVIREGSAYIMSNFTGEILAEG